MEKSDMSDAPLNDSQHCRGRRHGTRRPTVLFVDDDPDTVGAFVAAMQGFDVRVLTHYSGEQGYLAAMRSMPNLIITDLRMPQSSGEMLLECLHRNARTAAIPVIVLSGQQGPDVPGFVQHLGAARFLRKPIATTKLIYEIRRYVRLRPARGRQSNSTDPKKVAFASKPAVQHS
jgi:FixJ family two-component response regulator